MRTDIPILVQCVMHVNRVTDITHINSAQKFNTR